MGNGGQFWKLKRNIFWSGSGGGGGGRFIRKILRRRYKICHVHLWKHQRRVATTWDLSATWLRNYVPIRCSFFFFNPLVQTNNNNNKKEKSKHFKKCINFEEWNQTSFIILEFLFLQSYYDCWVRNLTFDNEIDPILNSCLLWFNFDIRQEFNFLEKRMWIVRSSLNFVENHDSFENPIDSYSNRRHPRFKPTTKCIHMCIL